MEREDCIAVIVPVYNAEKFLRQCVDSILAQEYQNLDILLVDDGSSDGSYEICRAYADKHRRVKALHQENRGILSAKLLGLTHTEADYVMFADADDWIKPEMCGRMIEAMKLFGVDMAASGIIRAYPDGACKFDYNAIPPGKYDGERYRNEVLPYMMCSGSFFHWGIDPSLAVKIFRKSLLLPIVERAAGYGFYYGEDTAVVYPYLLSAESVYIAEQCYYFHRQYENHSAFYTDRPEYDRKTRELYEYLRDIFASHELGAILLRQLDCFYAYTAYTACLQKIRKSVAEFPDMTASYLFPFSQVPVGSKVLLYGAGNVGKAFYRQLKQLNYCSELVWVDKNAAACRKLGLPVQSPEIDFEAEYCVIAISDRRRAEEARAALEKRGVLAHKIIWTDPALRLW